MPEYTRVRWPDLPGMRLDPLAPDHPWPSHENLDLRVYSVPLGCEHVAFSIGRLEPGQSVYHHRHREAEEIYVLMQGRSQIRIGDEVVEAETFDAFRIPPHEHRSVFNHTDEPCWWIFVGAPIGEFVAKPTYTGA